jgi:hypothetical protein
MHDKGGPVTSLLETAIFIELKRGQYTGLRLGEVYLKGVKGLSYLRYYSKTAPTPARRTAARVLHEFGTGELPPESDLADDLLGIAGLLLLQAQEADG